LISAVKIIGEGLIKLLSEPKNKGKRALKGLKDKREVLRKRGGYLNIVWRDVIIMGVDGALRSDEAALQFALEAELQPASPLIAVAVLRWYQPVEHPLPERPPRRQLLRREARKQHGRGLRTTRTDVVIVIVTPENDLQNIIYYASGSRKCRYCSRDKRRGEFAPFVTLRGFIVTLQHLLTTQPVG
jgi:hypothetical protein